MSGEDTAEVVPPVEQVTASEEEEAVKEVEEPTTTPPSIEETLAQPAADDKDDDDDDDEFGDFDQAPPATTTTPDKEDDEDDDEFGDFDEPVAAAPAPPAAVPSIFADSSPIPSLSAALNRPAGCERCQAPLFDSLPSCAVCWKPMPPTSTTTTTTTVGGLKRHQNTRQQYDDTQIINDLLMAIEFDTKCEEDDASALLSLEALTLAATSDEDTALRILLAANEPLDAKSVGGGSPRPSPAASVHRNGAAYPATAVDVEGGGRLVWDV